MSQQSRIIPNVLKAPDPCRKTPRKQTCQEFDIDPVALGNEATQPGETQPILGGVMKVMDWFLEKDDVLVGFWTKNFGW